MAESNSENALDESGLVFALNQARTAVLQKATSLMRPSAPIPFAEQFDALPSVSALLMTSLEELKVAEEELRQQNTLLHAQRAEVDERVFYYRQLFLHSPAPAIVTDLQGAIQAANRAAGLLFRREADLLVNKPLQALMPTENREVFRRQLARLSTDDGVADWGLVLHRVGDVPVRVSASVQFVPGVGRLGSGALYWLLRVISNEA
jgi:PAS domain S-box-containing protein